jgi:microcystin-dependent protein
MAERMAPVGRPRLVLLALALAPVAAQEPFIGQIIMFGGNFAPRGWAFCDGQLVSITQNTALFSILGTTYGGDGRTTFGLPDLRGRVPLHPGNGPGL